MPTFNEQTGANNPFDGIDLGSEGDPTLVDVDGDGDIDLVAGSGNGTLRYFENTGGSTAPSYSEQTGTNNPFDAVRVGSDSSPTFADIDGDGDLDLLAGGNNGIQLNYFQNTGSATSPSFSAQTGTNSPFNGLAVGFDQSPTLADIDGDGDFDLVVGDDTNQNSYFENTGSATNPSFSAQTGTNNPFDGIGQGSNNSPTLADIDGDGDLDLVMGESNASISYFENIGSATNPSFSAQTGTNNPFDGFIGGQIYATPTFADVDGDGDLDLVLGANQLKFFLNNEPAVITGDIAGAVTEDDETTMATGTLTATDVDSSTDFTAQTDVAGTYGSFSINAAGEWTYTLNNSDSDTEALAAGDVVTEVFTVATADGTTEEITITVAGANDAAIITGDVAGAVTEDAATTTATGTLTATDVDSSTDFTAQTDVAGTYGSFSIDADGDWTYTLDNSDTETNALAADQMVTDVFTVITADGTTQDVTITVTGTNDAPVAEVATNTATEEGMVVTGSVTSTDVDNDATAIYALTSEAPAGLTFNADGTYSFDPTNAAYRFLAQGETTDVVTTYEVTDDQGAADTNTLTITVTGVTGVVRTGTSGPDQFSGTSYADTLEGLDGNDRLLGGNGNDLLSGGNHSDTLMGEGGNDTLLGGDGIDRLFGGNDNDILSGGSNNDTLQGQSGDDLLLGGSDNDTLIDVEGNDSLRGGLGNDFLNGGNDNDVLEGQGGSDRLIGDSGNDILVGGFDNDTLTGGVGSDSFRFGRGFQSLGIDVLTDFASNDVLQLSRSAFDLAGRIGSAMSASDFATVGSLSAAGSSSASIVYNSESGNLYFNANGDAAGLGSGGRFARLANTFDLTVNQIELIA